MLAVHLILVDHLFYLDQAKYCINNLFWPRYPTSNHTLRMAHNSIKIHLLLNGKAPKCNLVQIPHLGHLVNFKLELISTNLELNKLCKEISKSNNFMYNKDLMFNKGFINNHYNSKDHPCSKKINPCFNMENPYNNKMNPCNNRVNNFTTKVNSCNDNLIIHMLHKLFIHLMVLNNPWQVSINLALVKTHLCGGKSTFVWSEYLLVGAVSSSLCSKSATFGA